MSENHPTSSSVKWEAFLSFVKEFLGCNLHGTSTCKLQGLWERLAGNQIFRHTFQASTVKHSWIPLAYDSHPSSMDCPSMRHCGRRCFQDWQALSVDCALDKWGILRQSWSSHVREPPTSSSVKWEVLLSLCVIHCWMQCAGAQQNCGVASVVWERLAWNQIASCTFTSTYWRTFMNHPGIWFSSQQHWSVPRHVTLWQKMLVTLPITFPFDPTHDKWGILKQSWSRHVCEPPNFFKCEVSAPFLVYNPFLDAICRAQQRAGCNCFMGKAALKPDHKLHIYKHILANIHESPWHMIPFPAALVCPKTCDTVAEDACNIASHLSIDRTHNKWGNTQAVLKQTCQRTTQLLPVWSERCSFPCV